MKKQKVNVNYPFTHRRKYHLLSGEKLYFISYIYMQHMLLYCSFFQKFCLYPASVKTYLVKNFLKRLIWST